MGSVETESVTILGVPVSAISREELEPWLDRQLGDTVCRHIATFNPEYAMLARCDPGFRQALLDADLITADGVGITIAARLQRNAPRIDRLTGVELLRVLAEAAARHQAPIFLLGAGPGVASAAADRLAKIVPDALFSGWWWDGTPAPADDAEALTRIAASGTRILAVAYGAPGQIEWIERNRTALTNAGVRIAIGVGGALDYWAGETRLAPPLVRKSGFEWLYRLVHEPWRWRRQRVLPVFALLAIRDATRSWLRR